MKKLGAWTLRKPQKMAATWRHDTVKTLGPGHGSQLKAAQRGIFGTKKRDNCTQLGEEFRKDCPISEIQRSVRWSLRPNWSIEYRVEMVST